MYLTNPFDTFDYMHSQFKEPLPIIFDQIANRARMHIKDRSKEEIEFAFNSINWMFVESNDYIGNDNPSSSVGDGELHRTLLIETNNPFITPAYLLNYRIDHFDISNQNDFKVAKREEYFAILALALLGNAFNKIISNDNYSQSYDLSAITALGMEATEAIVFAEKYSEFDLSEATYKKQFDRKETLKRSASAIKGMRKGHALKCGFIDFYKSGQFPSKAEAARKYFESLTPEEKIILAPSRDIKNATRNLCIFLSKNP